MTNQHLQMDQQMLIAVRLPGDEVTMETFPNYMAGSKPKVSQFGKHQEVVQVRVNRQQYQYLRTMCAEDED